MRARKRFGQNFLQDPSVIDRIAFAINPAPSDHILEIGPGHGALTSRLSNTGCKLDLVEIDRDLVAELTPRFPNAMIHSADILQFDFSSIAGAEKLRVVGNLPYNISTPLLFRLFHHSDLIQDMYFMLQLEVVNRLTASLSTGQYGRLSIMTRLFCDAEKLFDVPPEAFSPRPKVMSAIVRLTPRHDPPEVSDLAQFEKLLIHAFSQRRKTIRNALKNWCSAAELSALDIDPSLRPENIPAERFIACANFLATKGIRL
ncbi:MAG: 16S rRNA (adenine(1518)-N(6)/adenine(1519)-N(6))-dimethyltransferase RsmA [Pseudomonadales bacterium]|nr:16S rRNA (adenine(1518)-N(6)/adenine(1519)-N(6))-dimethyltransferase RsmA [Pseudomonadales bacterium]